MRARNKCNNEKFIGLIGSLNYLMFLLQLRDVFDEID